MVRLCVFIVAIAAVTCGCNPRTVIRKDPGPHDKGVRFYRPKPYLLLSPLEEKDVAGNITASREKVKITLEWLPDFSEEYSIDVRPGLGSNNTSISLEHGWNLTQLNVTIDSQVDENLSAVGGLVGAAAPLFSMKGAEAQGMVVPATNVPLGYYEAVLGRDMDGKKRLYGWRYLGFVPYAHCPIESTGVECRPCDDGSLDLYGLVFENGVMTFKPLHPYAADHRRVDPADIDASSSSSRVLIPIRENPPGEIPEE